MDMLVEMNIPLTDSDSDENLTENIKVTSTYGQLLLIEPPDVEKGYSNAPEEDLVGYELFGQQQSRVKTIDPEVHESLLSQSLEDHEEIWRSLARK